jgi:hypothetical protein
MIVDTGGYSKQSHGGIFCGFLDYIPYFGKTKEGLTHCCVSVYPQLMPESWNSGARRNPSVCLYVFLPVTARQLLEKQVPRQ